MSFDYLPRNMKYPEHGMDVLALERAMHDMGVRPHKYKADSHFGRVTRSEVKEIQRNHNLHADGVVGPRTSKILIPHYDEYGKYLIRAYKHRHPPTVPLGSRERIVRAALYCVAQRYYIHYLQRRPMYDMGLRPNVPNLMDCSTLATWCYKDAGLTDPNGYHYNGIGNTTTLLQHGTRVSTPRPGDLVFSYSPIEHVSVYIGGGKVVSHGHEGSFPQDDPAIYPLFSVTEIRSYV